MSRLGIAIYAFFIALFVVFCFFANRYDYFPGDVAISQWLQGIDLAWLETISFAPYVVGLLAVGFGLKLWRMSRWLETVAIVATGVAAGIAGWFVKLAVPRPRPDPELVQVMVGTQGLSFPSVHVALAVVICGFAFYLTPRLVRSPQGVGWLRVLLAASVLAVGFSRIYLGAHWASDVVGGLLLGGLILYPSLVIYRRYQDAGGGVNAGAA